MKILLINGSPHAKGTTKRALEEVAKGLTASGMEFDYFDVGAKPISGCLGCGYCRAHGNVCVINDVVNEFGKIAGNYDGYVFGTSVHYAAATGAITSFMDRAFFSNGSAMAYKPAAAAIVCRRGGASATLDQINKYFGINNMLTVGSNYWNSLHGLTPDVVEKDAEGLQTMRILGANMAWVVKALATAKENGVEKPQAEAKITSVFGQ